MEDNSFKMNKRERMTSQEECGEEENRTLVAKDSITANRKREQEWHFVLVSTVT